MTAVEHFETLYRADPDPWGYRTSPYEQAKYAETLAACGTGPFESALELGGAIGVFTACLAPSCVRLTTIDYAPSAVRAARAALAQIRQVEVLQGTIPDDLPPQRCDLVVASETLYYLDEPGLQRTLDALQGRIIPGGRLVLVHWRPSGPERPLTAAQVHDTVNALPWLESVVSERRPEYLLDAWERR